MSRLGRRSAAGVTRWARGSAWRSAAGLAGTLALTCGLAALWWPNGEYEPLRPGERGTLREVVRAASAIPSGRPSFTPERAVEYRDVPTVREEKAPQPRSSGDDAAGPAQTTTTQPPAGEARTTPQQESSEDPALEDPAPEPDPASADEAVQAPEATTTTPAAEQTPTTTTAAPEPVP